MAKYKVDITGIDTSNLKVLTEEEKINLFKKMKEDKTAREELITGNLRLVLSILKSFNNRTDNMDDLFQIGVIGLVKAIDNFDLSYNVKFSTYAVPMIIGEIRRYLRDNNIIRVSRSIKDIAYKAIKAQDEIFMMNGKEPNIEEISKKIDIPERSIINSLNATKGTVSMFDPIFDDGGETIYVFDQIENPKETSNNWNLRLMLQDAFSKIKDKERLIIIQRYVQGKTQMEISEELNISQAQVSRIEKNAINHIKKLTK